MTERGECIKSALGDAPIKRRVAFLYYEHKKKDRFRTVFFLSNPKDWHVISPQVSM